MRQPNRLVRSIDIATLEHDMEDAVDLVSTETIRLRVERAGIPVAAIVSIEDLKRLKRMDEQDRDVWEALEAIRAPFRGIPAEELEREAERAIAEDRAERQAEREQTVAVR